MRRPPGRGRLIGVVAPSYGLERMSYMIPSGHHRYVTLKQVPIHRLERRGTFLQYTPLLLGTGVDLVHTFNHLPLNRHFVVTAELEMPRYLGTPSARQNRYGLSLLASDRCRGIWALSEAARLRLVRTFGEAGHAALADKMTVFRGAVLDGPGITAIAGRAGPLRLLFVGGDGLRKGLGPVVDAAVALRAAGVEVELTVVGDPTPESYVAPGVEVPVAPLAARLAGESWISHYPTASNGAVRHMMAEHDLFLLPTMDESLGWVVAEAAMAGLPSIVTNIFALPEMVVDGETGWLILLPLDRDRRWVGLGHAGREEWEAAQDVIRDGLVARIVALAGRRDEIARAGLAARAHVAALYGVDVAGARLDRLYEQAITESG